MKIENNKRVCFYRRPRVIKCDGVKRHGLTGNYCLGHMIWERVHVVSALKCWLVVRGGNVN